MLFLQNLSISCPVRIIHGLKDTEVKAEGLIQLTKALDSTDVDLIYRSENGFSVHNFVPTSLQSFEIQERLRSSTHFHPRHGTVLGST